MKRILSVILTLSIVATLFAGLGISAQATEIQVEHATLNSNPALPTETSVVEKAPTVTYWHYDAAAGTTTQYTGWYNQSKDGVGAHTKLYDGNINNVFEAKYDSDGRNWTKLVTPAEGETKANYDSVDDGSFFMQIQYDFDDCYGNGINLSKVVVCGAKTMWSLDTYDLYVSDNIETLYTAPVYSYNNYELTNKKFSVYGFPEKSATTYTFPEGTTAKHVAIRVYKAHVMTDAFFDNQLASPATYRPRVAEFNVYGTKSTANIQNYTFDGKHLTSTDNNVNKTLAAAEAVGYDAYIENSLIRNKGVYSSKYAVDGVVKENTAALANKFATLTDTTALNQLDLQDGTRDCYLDTKGFKVLRDDEDYYREFVYELDAKANIDSISLASTSYQNSTTKGSLFAPYHIRYSLADNAADLFVEGKSTIYDLYNSETQAFLTINLTEDIAAKYVGARIITSVPKEFINSGWAQNYSTTRINHFDVCGTYVNPADATVEVEKDAAVADVEAITVSKDEPNISGITDTNGKYPVGSLKVNATEVYNDAENKLEYTFVGWYNGDTLVNANAEYTYDLTGDDVALTAKYNIEKVVTKYTLSFMDASKSVIGTIVVEEGKTPSVDEVKAINAKVKDIYGYNVIKDDGMVRWDAEVFEEVTGNKTFNARYEAQDISTFVVIYNLDSTTEYYREPAHQKFDTAIYLNVEDAKSYVDENDNVIVAAATGTIYACGERMKIYAKSATAEAPEVTFVGKDIKGGKFVVFAHAAPTAEVKAYGVIFASNTYKLNYDAQGENTGDMFTLKDTEAINKVNPSLKVSEVKVTNNANVDFMATLTGTDGKTRHARAYIIYSDDTVVYSDVIVTNN